MIHFTAINPNGNRVSATANSIDELDELISPQIMTLTTPTLTVHGSADIAKCRKILHEVFGAGGWPPEYPEKITYTGNTAITIISNLSLI